MDAHKPLWLCPPVTDAPLRRFAAVCMTHDGDGLPRFVLTCDQGGAWGVPAGNAIYNRPVDIAAIQTAWERAGVHALGLNAVRAEDNLPLIVPLRVESLAKVWPEDHRCQRRIVTLREACELIEHDALRRVLARLAREFTSVPALPLPMVA